MKTMDRVNYAEEGFRLFYQPVVYLRPSGSVGVVALEAFLRLEHPTQGLLMADAFVVSTREYGLLKNLGQWVVQQACADLAAWREHDYRGRVNINVSPSELTPEYAETVRRALERHGLSGDLLLLDITPDDPLSDDADTRHATRVLRRLGVRLLLDDFGRGNATLKTLNRFSISGIKFGRPPAGAEDPDALLLEELLDLTNESGRSLIVSRVETAAQRDCALKLGCRTQQGYFFADAIPADRVPAALSRLTITHAYPMATDGRRCMPAVV